METGTGRKRKRKIGEEVHPRKGTSRRRVSGTQANAAYEGLRVDWLHFITEGLKDVIGNLVDGKKP